MSGLPIERNIPILPCRSIDEQLAFYEAIGFEVTHRQKAPNVFAAVRRGPIELQFFVLNDYPPANNYSTCYVLTADVDRLYTDFRDGLRRALGCRAAASRIGALNDMSYEVSQFVMTDPGGSMVRIGQPITSAGGAAGTGEQVAPGEGVRGGQPAAALEGGPDHGGAG